MLSRLVMLAATATAGPQQEMSLPATPMPRAVLVGDFLGGGLDVGVVQVDGDDVRTFLDETQRHFATDAAARADDGDDLPREFLFRRHALEFCFLQQPVFDVEGFLQRQRDVGIGRFRAAHDLDRAAVKFSGDARFALVPCPTRSGRHRG